MKARRVFQWPPTPHVPSSVLPDQHLPDQPLAMGCGPPSFLRGTRRPVLGEGVMVAPFRPPGTARLQEESKHHLGGRLIAIPEFLLLCRLRSQFLERTQESDDIFPAQHADDMVVPSNGQLVDSIAVHLLDGGPQLGIRIDAF